MKNMVLVYLVAFALPVFAQDMNQELIDEDLGKNYLIGFCDRSAFLNPNYSEWFTEEYDNYALDFDAIESFRDAMEDVHVTIVIATWCSDSRREVPRFYRILDELFYPEDKVTLISVNMEKMGLKDEVDDLNILSVPTFIFYRNSEEIGRIIESPDDSLESDLRGIVVGK